MEIHFILDSSRVFQFWQFDISHGLLLLRIVKSENPTDKQIDLLFRNVYHIDMPRFFEADRLVEVDFDKSFLNSNFSHDVSNFKNLKLFKFLHERTVLGLLFASLVEVDFDSGDYFSINKILESNFSK